MNARIPKLLLIIIGFSFISCEKETIPITGLDELVQDKWRFNKLKKKYFAQKDGQLIHSSISDTSMFLSFDRFNQYYDALVNVLEDSITQTPLGVWRIDGTNLVLIDSVDRVSQYGLSIPSKGNAITLSFDSILDEPSAILYQNQEYLYQYIEYQLSGTK